MISVDKAVVAKYSAGAEHFEILVDPDKALEFRHNKAKIEDVLAVEEIFKSVSTAEHVPDQTLQRVFGTLDRKEIASKIILQGDVQLTTDQKRRMVEERRKQIVSLISRLAINPQTGSPHPPLRIEMALEQVRFHPEPFKSAEEQMDAAVKLLRPLLPIKFEVRSVAVKVPAEYVPKVYKIVHSHTIKKEEYQSDGSLIVLVEIPAGVQDEFYGKLNDATKGSVQTKIIGQR